MDILDVATICVEAYMCVWPLYVLSYTEVAAKWGFSNNCTSSSQVTAFIINIQAL